MKRRSTYCSKRSRTGYLAGQTCRVGVSRCLDRAVSERHLRLPQIWRPHTQRCRPCGVVRAVGEAVPIVSIEDGLGDDDWDGWQLLTKERGERVRLISDD